MKTVIAGVDLSEQTETVVAHAVELARPTEAEVILVLACVIPETGDDPSFHTPAAQSYLGVLREGLAADRAALGELRERWLGRGVRISQAIVDGFADEQLPRVATEIGADLIVVGSHGRTGIKRFLIGSVAERVTRLAGCSVLVARGAAPTGGYRHLVVGTDFSPIADRALGLAIDLAPRGAQIDLVHCWRMPAVLMPPDAPALIPTYDQLRTDLQAELTERGRALVARNRTDLDLRFHLQESPAAHGLEDFARGAGADLVVVGSHGRRGIRRFVLGSVAEVTVRHAPCSVLVAR